MSDTTKSIIDAHCHYFNAGFALREAAAIGWNMLWGRYPYKAGLQAAGPRKFPGAGALSSIEGWQDLLDYIAQLLQVSLGTCDENYRYELDEFAASALGPGTSLLAAPLMMDIYFIMDDNKNEEQNLLTRTPQPCTPIERMVLAEHEVLFKEFLQEMKRGIADLLKNYADTAAGRQPDGMKAKIDSLFSEIEGEFLRGQDADEKSRPCKSVDTSPGYKKHMEDLERLKSDYHDAVFPFLAVDPRRRGVMDLIKEKVGQGDGPFRGIKLYPPLGYLPSHPDLIPVYDYCVKYDIPVTAHTSHGGIATAKKNIYVRSFDDTIGSKWVDLKKENLSAGEYFANPSNWEIVLKKYSALRLNLAHFGGCSQCVKYPDTKDNWTIKIIDLLEKYQSECPNLYCDISYYKDDKAKDIINNKIIPDHPIVKKRLMFGTDYVMIMKEPSIKGLRDYFNKYTGLFDEQYRENAVRFLKL